MKGSFLVVYVCVSYVIQNFFKINPTFRLTYRKYFYWLCRNSALLLLNFMSLSKISKNFNSTSTYQVLHKQTFISIFFMKSLQKNFSRKGFWWRPLVESAPIRGFEYWSYKYLNYFFIKPIYKTSVKNKLATTTLFNNQLVLEKKYSKMSTFNKVYRKIFIDFFKILITYWQVWRPQYFLQMNCLLLSKDWVILKRFNTRFFKVFFI